MEENILTSIALVFYGAHISISRNVPLFDLWTGRGRVLKLKNQYEQVCVRAMWLMGEKALAAEGKDTCKEGQRFDASQAGRGQFVTGTQ